ncbi:hypothetical protein C7974DRAFT_431182 [Boeremia exigua]|uniref:uncharacterized protein n=1 Tax=Boeremia exigua TaxID=749465 RepID=UPI001E8EC751|nr:uncharacterized protein C7974DRAFT_431182 [Boeremia exigua]KAH6642826.1 hypothetical protein C7974DRAFT_431182 [Boeremia exigua]
MYPECDPRAHQHADAVGHVYECETCTEAWYLWQDASAHMDEEDHWEKAHKCEACQQSFHSRAEAKQHIIHRGTDIACPFCKRGFATATSITHHLETSSCKNARSFNRNTILTEVRRRDTSQLITKKNLHISMHKCYLCHKGFCELKTLNNYVHLPAHKEHVYHCPGRIYRREFRSLAFLFNHPKSETCGVRFDAVQRNFGGTLSGQRSIGSV